MDQQFLLDLTLFSRNHPTKTRLILQRIEIALRENALLHQRTIWILAKILLESQEKMKKSQYLKEKYMKSYKGNIKKRKVGWSQLRNPIQCSKKIIGTHLKKNPKKNLIDHFQKRIQ